MAETLQPPRRDIGRQLPIILRAREVHGRPDLDASAEGDVEFRRGTVVIRADRLTYDRAEDLAQRLALSTQEAARWRQEAADLIAGLGDAIDRQLERWGLSQAEKEVALLLLKGLSHKEIGQMRNVAEATVRQQGRAIYQKAGLGGRHELAAFFLEDLLDPRPGRDSQGRARD
jgi:DNA-binding CsgD family transcriptional regulator